MRPIPPSLVLEGHRDYELLCTVRDGLASRTGSLENLKSIFPILVRDAIDFLLDPVRTARTKISDLDNVEKTFIGLKLEHFVRDMLDVPKGLRDLHILGHDVDIKNTVKDTWTIPPETFNREEVCLLMASDDERCLCWLGLIVARREFLTGGLGNRDAKRAVNGLGFKNILWIVENAQFPPSKFSNINMDRFRQLRELDGGTNRVELFFSENLRIPIHRSVVLSLLYDQDDPMKRVRGNSGARDRLKPKGIALLSGRTDASLIAKIGIPNISANDFISIQPLSDEERQLLLLEGKIE